MWAAGAARPATVSRRQGTFGASSGTARPPGTRVAWVRDPFERLDVDNRDEKAIAVWRGATDEGANRSDSVYEWLRR
jgi:hypothetical protein